MPLPARRDAALQAGPIASLLAGVLAGLLLGGCVAVQRDASVGVLALAEDPATVFADIVVGETPAADLAQRLGPPRQQRPLDNGNALHAWVQPGVASTRVRVTPLLDLRVQHDTATRWLAEVRDGTVVRYWSE